MPSLYPVNTPGQVLTAFLLLSQRWHISSSLWSLPGPQIWAGTGFLCVLTRCLPKLAFAVAIGSVHRELVTGWECMWVGFMEHWGCLWARWGYLWVRCPQGLMGRLLGRVYDMVSRICIPLMPSESSSYNSPSLFPTPKSWSSSFSTLDGEERNKPLWQQSHCLGSQVGTNSLSLSPTQEITGWEDLSWP